MTETLEVLRGARGRVERGWTQGHREHFGRVCALGGIDVMVPRGTKSHWRAKVALWRKLPLPYKLIGVAGYNDSWNRQKKDVLCLFDKAIGKQQKKRDRQVRRAERNAPMIVEEEMTPPLLGAPLTPTFIAPNLPRLPVLLTVKERVSV